MTLAQFTEPKLLVPRLLSNHRESAIIELSRRLKSAGRIENADSFVDAAMDHESIASAVFDGVTFPLALWSSTVRQPGGGDTAYSTGRVLWSSSSCLLWYLRQPLLHGAKARDVWSPESFR